MIIAQQVDNNRLFSCSPVFIPSFAIIHHVPAKGRNQLLSFSKDFVFGGFESPPCRVRREIALAPRFSPGPVYHPEHLSPAVKITARIPLPKMLQSCLSRLGDPIRGEHLPQAQLVGGQFFIAVDAEGVAQDGAVLCT